MPTTVTLTSPGPLDLQPLVDTTRLSIAMLKPWIAQTPQLSDFPVLTEHSTKPVPCRSDNAVIAALANQAPRYADAIQLTVAAACSGFIVAKDVLYLARMLEDSKTKKTDISEFAAGTLTLAMESK